MIRFYYTYKIIILCFRLGICFKMDNMQLMLTLNLPEEGQVLLLSNLMAHNIMAREALMLFIDHKLSKAQSLLILKDAMMPMVSSELLLIKIL